MANAERRFLYIEPAGEIVYSCWENGKLKEHKRASEVDSYKIIGMTVVSLAVYKAAVEEILQKEGRNTE